MLDRLSVWEYGSGNVLLRRVCVGLGNRGDKKGGVGVQGCQLSCIDCDTHAIDTFSHALTSIFSRNEKRIDS